MPNDAPSSSTLDSGRRRGYVVMRDSAFEAFQYSQQAFARLLDNEAFSDFTIECGNKRWRVNRAILAARSLWFKTAISAACNAKKERIALEYDDPEAVDALLNFLYTAKYNGSLDPRLSEPSESEDEDEGEEEWDEEALHADGEEDSAKTDTTSDEDSSISSDGDDDDEQAPAVDSTQGVRAAETNPATGEKVKTEHEEDEETAGAEDKKDHDAESEDSDSPGRNPLILHARVYAIAKKYGVEGLISMAEEAFIETAKADYDGHQFLQAALLIYATTDPEDYWIRKSIGTIMRDHADDIRRNVMKLDASEVEAVVLRDILADVLIFN